MTTLFLASTPLHVFFSLGLMRGPFKGQAHTLVLIDQRPAERDYIAEALEARSTSKVSVVRFPALLSVGPARRLLREISDFTAALAPSTLAIGNDRRTEFYAAVRGCPGARRTYIDDGLYSYLPRQDAQPVWRQNLSSWRRRLKYGLHVERPSEIGGSQAVQDAYVLLPEQVHSGLKGKPVQPLRPEWFADAWVREVCMTAAVVAGFDAARCEAIRLLLLLPHPRFLQAYPDLRQRIEALARTHAERGDVVALKAHPAGGGIPLHRQLSVPAEGVVEVPARLPVEVLVPLLSGALVVGTLTTALLSMVSLGDRVTVRSVLPQSARGAGRRYNDRAFAVYESVGIRPIDDDATA